MKEVSDKVNLSTITDREIRTAVKLALPGELAKHAISEGSKALSKYKDSVEAKKNYQKNSESTDNEKSKFDHEFRNYKIVSKSMRSGLQFSVGKINSYLKLKMKERISVLSSIYLTAVIEVCLLFY